MKNFNLIIFVITLILAACGEKSNTSSEKPTYDIHILVDNTEANLDSREDLVSTDKITEMVQNGGSVTWQQVNAVTLNSNKTIELSLPEDPTNFQKRNALEPFVKKFEEMRKKFLGPVKKGTENSSIYKPVCQALTKLTKSKANQKILIIVSDMIENSEYGNFYREQKFEIAKMMLDSSGASLVDPGNLKIVILYDPQGDPRHEQQFNRAMKYWGQLFEEVNISWEVKPNL